MSQSGDEPSHAVIARRAVAVVYDQVLVNPHRLQALLDLRQDLFPERRVLPAGVKNVLVTTATA
jgi:hypothetical protein